MVDDVYALSAGCGSTIVMRVLGAEPDADSRPADGVGLLLPLSGKYGSANVWILDEANIGGTDSPDGKDTHIYGIGSSIGSSDCRSLSRFDSPGPAFFSLATPNLRALEEMSLSVIWGVANA